MLRPERRASCICLVATALFAAAGRVYAQQASAPVFQTEVVVTAERGENERDRLSVPTVVLTRQDIERTPGATLADAIEALPGFQMLFAPGSSFRPTTVARGFFGGGEAEYVKLLVDGIPMNDAESGLVDWTQIPLFAIERIEALRGPASAVYGDTSLGGVIQVFTQGPNVRRGRAQADGGTFGHRSVNAGYRQPFGRLSADLLGSYAVSRGFRDHSARREGNASGSLQRADGSRRWNARGAFDYLEREEPGALTHTQIVRNRTESDPLFRHDRDMRRKRYGGARYASAHGRFTYSAMVNGSARSGQRVRTLLLAPGLGDAAHRDIATSTAGASLETSIITTFVSLPGHFRSGIDLSRDRADVSYRGVAPNGSAGPALSTVRGDRSSVAGYAAQSIDFHPRVRVDAGIRWDRLADESSADVAPHTAWSPKAGATAFVGSANRPVALFAHMSRAFKAATLDQLFDPRPFPDFRGGTFLLSNPSLRPQRGTSIDGGVRQTSAKVRWELVLYRMKMTDEIDFDPATFTYANIGRSTHSGAEIDTSVLAGSRLSAGLNYTWTRVTPGGGAAYQLKNIPRHLVRPHATFTLPYDTFVHARYVHTSGAFADDSNDFRLRDRSTLDVRVSKKWSKTTMKIDLFNLTGDRYDEIGYVLADFRGNAVPFFYPAPEFRAIAGVEFTF